MGLSQVPDEMLFYGTLTAEEKGRIHPCTRAKCVMRAGDSPPPMQASIPTGYDSPDDAGVTERMTTPTAPVMRSVKPLRLDGETDAEMIEEEALPIVHKSLPTPEPKPKVETNGYDQSRSDEKKLVNEPEDEPCIVKCVYIAQQCCECTIL